MTPITITLRAAVLRRYDAFDADLLAHPERTQAQRQDAWRALLAALDEPLRALENTCETSFRHAHCQRHALNRLLKLEGLRYCKVCGQVKALAGYHIYEVGGRSYYRPECAACVYARVSVGDAERHRVHRVRKAFAAVMGGQA